MDKWSKKKASETCGGLGKSFMCGLRKCYHSVLSITHFELLYTYQIVSYRGRHAEIYRFQRGEALIKAKQYQEFNREQNATQWLSQDTNREEKKRAVGGKKEGS